MANIINDFIKNFSEITKYYNFLVEKTKKHQYIEITNEWIVDNYYLLVEHKNSILESKKEFLKDKKIFKKNYNIIKDIAIRHNYNINFKILVEELNLYQKNKNELFTYKELNLVIPTLLFIYYDKLNELCKCEYSNLLDKQNVNNIIKNHDVINFSSLLPDKFDIKNNKHYIFEINAQLNKIGNSNEIFKELNKCLEKNNIILKDLIKEDYQNKINNNILVSNIFEDLKEFFEFSSNELYEKVSKSEILLLTDPIYKNMTIESKELYRKKIVALSKKNNMHEYEYLKNIFRRDEHIGFKLIKKENSTLKVLLYILSIILTTSLLSYILSSCFIKNRLLGFFILFVPISQLLIQIFNQFLTRFVPATVIPKLDYSKGIKDESRTMVVIPTILSNKEKIKDMFDTLESFYLVNKTDNLYFTLLGDVKSSSKKIEEYDDEISNYGKKIAQELNKKYKKEIFYFIYRKRIWNSGENSYLGYERKRGALLQFNKILLGKEIDENKYFNVNTLHGKKLNIKYVITLDTDTKLVLNSALSLIGAMAHPLNKPILNKEHTKVISGYGLMQPRIGVDIEATNRSFYSQIFAGIGGFDTYSSIVPNVYQDLFDEGSFVGKGIYDLKVFDEILSDAFKDNLVLSHDLIEGNYLRVGYVSDIELVDDFPSKFIVDVTRQHRWARGDTQIIGWLFKKVRNKDNVKVKNPINILGQYKIFDNILRMFLNPMLLLILLLGFTGSVKKSMFWVFFVILEIAVYILFYLKSKINIKEKEKIEAYYDELYAGGKSLMLRSYIMFATIPYYTKLYMDAFFRSLYRMFISHKNLLNWITAEEVEKTVNSSLKTYIKSFVPNLVAALIFILISIFTGNLVAIFVAIIFISGPFVIHEISKDINYNKINLSSKKIEEIEKLAFKTWKYFEDNLKEEYNYLIPDNYQENREEKIDKRTSPTAIGYSLTSIVSAYELGFINKEKAIDLIGKILKTVDSLKKWHGHLYNWYDIETTFVMKPNFISTVDSGNLVASLIVVKEFLNDLNKFDLVKLCDKLIKNTNFKKLYANKNVFSIGYDEDEGKLSIYNYNKFASESRLTSYIAIALGDIPNKHWFSLDKSLTIHKGKKGLISWSGTSFEYYMPLLFMKNYPNTLLDETYNFARFCQKDFMYNVNPKLPWGISESAYSELDNLLNYKYKAFSTPYLKAKESKENKIVISPYSSLMVIDMYPNDVYNNIKKFKKLGMDSNYGLYESYDYDNKKVVDAYFAHHQGMSLLGITNYLKQGIIKNYFHKNVNIKAFEILLKEKVQIKTTVDMKMAKYKKYNYKKELIENDIRSFNYISYMPEMSVLSNKKYSLIMNDRGNSFSRYKTIQLNRYRKVTEQDYGIFLFVKDKDTNYIWSNTYSPMNKKPEKYEVVFAQDKIKYLRRDNNITTKTEIVVCKGYNAEIRKITFKNENDTDRSLELTSYTEPIISLNSSDISHRAFNNMFVSTEYDSETNTLIAKRRNRETSKIDNYMLMRLLIDEPYNDYSYETERSNFIGRGKTLDTSISLNKKLTNYAGDNLDPVLSIRNEIVVPSYGSKSVYLLIGYGRSREQISKMIEELNENSLEKSFKISSLMNAIDTKNMELSGEKMRLYTTMINYLFQTTSLSVRKNRNDYLRRNALSQSSIWKYGISGDRPIITVKINDISDMSFIHEVLKAFEYFKMKSIFVDLVIIVNENEQYRKMIKREIDDEIYRIYTTNDFDNVPGDIKIISKNIMTENELLLFDAVSRLNFDIEDHITLKEAIESLQKNNIINNYPKPLLEENMELSKKQKLVFDNNYGGFKNNGKEYLIYNKNTPTPWSNVISNDIFGTIVTNNGCGYTYSYNSSEFKLTSWTNDPVLNDKSEGFKFNGKIFEPERCTHGFGYSILESETKDLYHEITEFVAKDEPIKIYLMKLKNNKNSKHKVNIEFWINPTFGSVEEKTTRHILTELDDNNNYLNMRNVYSIDYSNVNVFMSSSEKIKSAICDKMLVKSILIDIDLKANEDKTVVFTLGCSQSVEENLKLIELYSNVNNAVKELREVKNKWNNDLSIINVKTPDDSFNYVINGWYLYQTISSRIKAKAGFYQVSGAFGFRDQLQDSFNIALVESENARRQILVNASHQFEEGDVLHWWHEKNKFGLRSRYKDDYLWLVYATSKYINTTGDYNILNEQIPFAIGDKLKDEEHEKGIIFGYSENTDTLLNHCLKSIELAINSLGSHKLPLMGGGDWNDGMNKVGIEGKGESVWLGFFLYNVIDLFSKILQKYNIDIDVLKYLEFNELLKKNLNKYAWDGEYYLRAFFDNGDKLGSHENLECKIDAISQSFSIISEVVPKERILDVINSVETNLVDHENKLIKLLTPPFNNSINNPGYIMSYPNGIRENGGQYTHGISWYIIALIKAGFIDKAYEYYKMINPINRSLKKCDVLKYKVEPYVIAGDIYSSKYFPGRGGWTWYTGSSGWFYKIGIEDILGLKKEGNKLRIEPNIPSFWNNYKIKYKYMNTTYNIEVIRNTKNEVIFDNKIISTKTIVLKDDKLTHDMTVYFK